MNGKEIEDLVRKKGSQKAKGLKQQVKGQRIEDLVRKGGSKEEKGLKLFCTVACKIFIEPPPDTQRTERQGGRGI